MLFIQISDIHIAGWDKKTYGVAPMAENLIHFIDHINLLDPRPEFVLLTGDITKEGSREEYERIAYLLRKLQFPFYMIPGNHDDRSNMWSVFGGDACPSKLDQFICYVIEDHPVRLIGMDSTVPGKPGGEICTSRVEWLDHQLSLEKEQPTIVFMHHPPLNFGVAETDIDGFIGSEELGKVIDKYRNIERVMCGHIHLSGLVQWRGTVVSTAPAAGMQLVPDLTLKKASKFSLSTPGYQLHYWSPEKNLVSLTIHLPERDRSYLFEEID